MKYIFLLVLILVFSCRNTNTQKQNAPDSEIKTEMAPENALKFSVAIEGMTCTGCEQTIQNSVKTVDGVINIKADHESGIASVTTDPGLTDTTIIRQKIEEAGYQVKHISQKK